MLFFDFLYYLIFKFYSGYGEKGAESTSAGIVGGFQALNVLTIIMLVQSMDRQKSKIDKLLVIALFIVFQIHTYIRYIYRDKHSTNVIENKWLSKIESSRKKTSFILFLYGVISILGCLVIVMYLGGKN